MKTECFCFIKDEVAVLYDCLESLNTLTSNDCNLSRLGEKSAIVAILACNKTFDQKQRDLRTHSFKEKHNPAGADHMCKSFLNEATRPRPNRVFVDSSNVQKTKYRLVRKEDITNRLIQALVNGNKISVDEHSHHNWNLMSLFAFCHPHNSTLASYRENWRAFFVLTESLLAMKMAWSSLQTCFGLIILYQEIALFSCANICATLLKLYGT